MPQIAIDSLDHPLLEPFREIRNRNWTEQSGLFIAEGPLLVQNLVKSKYTVKSILLDRKYEQHYQELAAPETELLMVDHSLIEQIVGFNFHRGVMGCGLRQPLLSLQKNFTECPHDRETMVCVVGVQDPENLGGILRSCAALGIERVIVGPGTADPLSRRVLRVSMGNVLRLKLYRSRNLVEDLPWLREAHSITSVAATLADDAQTLEQMHRHGPTIILLGNERHGLPEDIQALSDHRVRIDMELGTDSLNVSVAAGIVMHYFCRLAT